MRFVRGGAIAAVLVVSLGCASVAARDGAALPWNPLATAQSGEWATYTGNTTVKKLDAGGEPLGPRLVVEVRVGDRERGNIRIDGRSLRSSDTGEDEDRDVFSLEPDLVALFVPFRLDKNDHSGMPEKLVVTDEKRKLGDKEVVCQKLAFDWVHGQSKDAVTMWICKDVKGPAIVALSAKGPAGAMDLELAGYGTAKATLFGKSVKELHDPLH